MTLTVPEGSTNGSMLPCLEVTIDDDAALEGEETFAVTLTTPVMYVMLGNTETEVTISDDDSKSMRTGESNSMP